jgi:hypothetical protein
LAVACRVEPMVTHPAPPQTRTCAMHAYGSSGRAAATHARSPLLHSPLACRGQGWGARGLSPVSRQRMRCPTAPSLPWVAWASLPHLRRYSAPLRLPPCPSRGPSRVARSPIPCLLPSFVVSLTGSWPGGSSRSRQGLWSPGPPLRACGQGDRGLSHVPECPLWRHAPLSDPGGVLRTRHTAPRTAAFQCVHTVGSPRLYTCRGSITRPAFSLHPAPYGPLRGGTRVRS